VMQSFVSERSLDQDLACADRFTCNVDDMIQYIQSFGSGKIKIKYHVLLPVLNFIAALSVCG